MTAGAEKIQRKLRPEKTWQHHIGREFNSPHLHNERPADLRIRRAFLALTSNRLFRPHLLKTLLGWLCVDVASGHFGVESVPGPCTWAAGLQASRSCPGPSSVSQDGSHGGGHCSPDQNSRRWSRRRVGDRGGELFE